MTTLRARPVQDVDFSAFGEHIRLVPGDGVEAASGDGWHDLSTAAEVVCGPAQIGMTVGSAAPFSSASMERHRNTREVIVCVDDPVILAVAAPTAGPAPVAADVTAVVLEPGDVVVLAPGTWHDACHGVAGPARYVWVAGRVDGADAAWVPIVDGPVEVRC